MVDLFATRLNAQLKHLVSWRPEPNPVGTDALHLPLDRWEAKYAFPPFCLIEKCSRKVREDQASLVLVAPVCREISAVVPGITRTASELSPDTPKEPTLLTDLFNNPHPLVAAEQLQLVAWKLSSVDSKQKEFLKKLSNCWQLDGVEAQI